LLVTLKVMLSLYWHNVNVTFIYVYMVLYLLTTLLVFQTTNSRESRVKQEA